MHYYNVKGSLDQMITQNVVAMEIIAGEDWTFRRTSLHRPAQSRMDVIQGNTEFSRLSYNYVQSYWETIKDRIPKNFELLVKFSRFSHNPETFYPFLESDFFLHGAIGEGYLVAYHDIQSMSKWVGIPTLPELYKGQYVEGLSEVLLRYPSTARLGGCHGIFLRRTEYIRVDDMKNVSATFCYYPLVTTKENTTKRYKENGKKIKT